VTRLPAGHPWMVPVTELTVALGRAAGLAEGGNPVIVRPRRDIPIERAKLYVRRCEELPGTSVWVLNNLAPTTADNMARLFVGRARQRAAGYPDVPNIIIVTHAPTAELERALGRPVSVIETTPVTAAEVVQEPPAIGDLEREL
jgi:hypothetical protein